MKIIDSIPKQRLFLPSAVRLQSNVSDGLAILLNAEGDERAHDYRVRELSRPRSRRGDARVPYLWIDADEVEILVMHADRELSVRLREYGFEPSPWRADTLAVFLDEDKVLDTLAWAASVGVGLSPEAWEELEEAGRAGCGRRLAWDGGDAAFGDGDAGDWAERLRDEARVRTLLKAMRHAIRSSSDRAVHLVPTPDGELLQRHDCSDMGIGLDQGCGALVVRREDFRLRVYLPQEDWLSWALQRVLLDAWAEEMFGAGTPWHWG